MSSSLYSRLADQGGLEDKGQQDRYRAVSALAVASLVLGLLSALTVSHWGLGLIPAVGIVVGYLALRRIRQAPEELFGATLALVGIGLSMFFCVLGYGVQLFVKSRAFPFGYDPVKYEVLQPDLDVPGELVPPMAYQLQYDQIRNNKVGIEGYMYPGRQTTRMKTFYLCPAIPNCPFCAPNPKPTEMVRVKLEGDLEATYTTNLIRVGGKFRVDEMAMDGVPYQIDADFLALPR